MFTLPRSYEAGVIASIFQLPAWIAHVGYPGQLALPKCVEASKPKSWVCTDDILAGRTSGSDLYIPWDSLSVA